MNHEQIRRLTQQREVEWQEIQNYITEQGCLMEFLAKALDDAEPQACGKCASCLGRPIVDTAFTRESAISAARFLRHSEFELECNRQVAKDAFPQYGFQGNLPAALRAETGRTLTRWGDAGWGQLVAEDKRSGYFREELVNAVVDMLRDRWQPSPPPTWVTCVPSKNNPDLVPNYARRLADALDLPFTPVVLKVKDNNPQKEQQNRYHQCRNLDKVFAIDGIVPVGPVLLVDDIVDSRWTLTVIAALLRQAGSGPVWPLALAASSAEA